MSARTSILFTRETIVSTRDPSDRGRAELAGVLIPQRSYLPQRSTISKGVYETLDTSHVGGKCGILVSDALQKDFVRSGRDNHLSLECGLSISLRRKQQPDYDPFRGHVSRQILLCHGSISFHVSMPQIETRKWRTEKQPTKLARPANEVVRLSVSVSPPLIKETQSRLADPEYSRWRVGPRIINARDLKFVELQVSDGSYMAIFRIMSVYCLRSMAKAAKL